MVHKVDPHYNAYRRQKSSIRSCIGNNYAYVYEVGCRIVALKSWYQHFLPDTPETTFSFRNGMLRNLLDAFTVHGPTWHGLGPFSISDKTLIRRLIVRSREVSKPQDLCLKLSDRSEIWQAPRQQCCQYVSVKYFKMMRNIKQSRSFETSRDFTLRVLSESYRILKWDPWWWGPPPCTKLVRMWNRLEVSRARAPGSWWRLQLVFTALKIAMMWSFPVLCIEQNKG